MFPYIQPLLWNHNYITSNLPLCISSCSLELQYRAVKQKFYKFYNITMFANVNSQKCISYKVGRCVYYHTKFTITKKKSTYRFHSVTILFFTLHHWIFVNIYHVAKFQYSPLNGTKFHEYWSPVQTLLGNNTSPQLSLTHSHTHKHTKTPACAHE